MFPYKSLLFTFILAAIAYNLASAQPKPVKITVNAPDKTTLPGATLQLKNDIGGRHFSTTNLDGIAVFEKVTNGKYALNISFIGYAPLDTTLVITSASRNFAVTMQTSSIGLQEVNIVARRPIITQEDDKTIIDPSPLVNTATNTLEVLESTPGVYVDQESGIYLSGTTPAAVYINGREQKMGNQDLNTILRSLPPSSIEKIELLRTPSAKFDAASSGGIVNIVLKKGMKIGRFGSVSGGMNQGKYGNRFVGFSLNGSGNRNTTYLTVNVSDNNQFDKMNSARFLKGDTTLKQASNSTAENIPLFTSFGITYDFNPRVSLSSDSRVNTGFRNGNSTNVNTIQSSGTVLSQSENPIENHNLFTSIQQEISLIIKLDTADSKLENKLSYSFNRSNFDQDYATNYIYPVSTTFSGGGSNLQDRHYIVYQSDLNYRLPFSINLETGVKTSWQSFKSNADYFYNIEAEKVTDTQRTNAFSYRENISAAYLQASGPLFAQIRLKAGARMEYTFMDGKQTLPSDTGFLVKRFDFFPYVYLSRPVIKIMGAEIMGYLIYRRTINRPGYQELNPSTRFIDQFLYESGNPALTPQFTQNVEANVSFNDFPVFAVGRNVTTNIFSTVMYPYRNTPDILLRTYDNLGKNTETYFRGVVGMPPGGKYFFALGTQYSFTQYDGYYDNKPWKYKSRSWRFFTFHSLNLAKNTKLTVNGFLMTRGQWNFYELKTFGQLNAGITQTFLNKRLTITLNARDIFKTMVNNFTFTQGDIVSSGDRYSDNRRIGLNIRYNFGIGKKEEQKMMQGFEEQE